MDSPSPGPYKVEFLPTAKEQVRAAASRATTREVRQEFLDTVREIYHKLEVDPVNWGDPLRWYENAGLLQLRSLHKMIVTNYGVDQANKLVYVTECKPVLSHPLAET